MLMAFVAGMTFGGLLADPASEPTRVAANDVATLVPHRGAQWTIREKREFPELHYYQRKSLTGSEAKSRLRDPPDPRRKANGARGCLRIRRSGGIDGWFLRPTEIRPFGSRWRNPRCGQLTNGGRSSQHATELMTFNRVASTRFLLPLDYGFRRCS